MNIFRKGEIDEKLAEMNRSAEERDAKRRAEKENIPYVNLNSVSINLDALKLISEKEARESGMAAFGLKQKELLLAVFDGEDGKTKMSASNLESRGYELKVFISSIFGLRQAWNRYGEIKSAPEESLFEVILKTAGVKNLEDVSVRLSEMLGDNLKEASTPLEVRSDYGTTAAQSDSLLTGSTTEILELILSSAVALKASDIHFETEEGGVLLRLRLDGLLYDVCVIPYKIYISILSRIKLLSGLKINIADASQDGRFTIKNAENEINSERNREIEIRTSIVPSEYGETIVMRVLDSTVISLTLADLGLRKSDEEIALKELKKPNGMILVTGPTGSGKTTTLYAFLKKVKSSELKIITIEDPIEYHLDGIEQTQVDSKSGYNFNSGLRSILRQDPDIILVGEVRDLETAEIAMHSALTGHLVFSTLHTNDAVGAVPRLVDLGVKTSIIGPALNLIIGQRLVRRLCGNCKIETAVSEDAKLKFKKFLAKLPKEISLNTKIKQYSASGCDKCRKGFRGRLGVFEFLKFDDEFESLIVKEATEEAIRKLAVKQGMIGIQADGILKTFLGLTTIEEVERVTGPIDW